MRARRPHKYSLGSRPKLAYMLQAAFFRMRRMFVKPDYTPAIAFPKPADVKKVLVNRKAGRNER